MLEYSQVFMKPQKRITVMLVLLLSNLLCFTESFAQKINQKAEPLFINVREMGAKGDGKTDDSVAIQKAFDKACAIDKWVNIHVRDKQASRTVIIPTGDYIIRKTLILDPRHVNLVIKGTGGSKAGNTRLIWDGAKGGNLLEAWGVSGFEIYDLRLEGKSKCGILVRLNSIDGPAYMNKMKKVDKELGLSYFKRFGQKATGENTFERLYLNESDTGMSLGDSSYICTSDMTFSDVTFRKCKTGFITNSPQNVVYHFTRTNLLFCDTGLYFKRGGYATFSNLGGSGGGIAIRIGKQGINNGVFNFTGMRVEAEMFKGKRTQMLLAEGGETIIHFSSMIVTCQGLFGKNSDRKQPMFVVKGGARVIVENSLITGNVGEVSSGGWLQFKNCRFRVVSDPRKIKYDKKSGFELNNCIIGEDKFDENGKYIYIRTINIEKFIKRPANMIKFQEIK